MKWWTFASLDHLCSKKKLPGNCRCDDVKWCSSLFGSMLSLANTLLQTTHFGFPLHSAR